MWPFGLWRLRRRPSGTTGDVQRIRASGGAIAAMLAWGNSACGSNRTCSASIHHSFRALVEQLNCEAALGHVCNLILEVVSCIEAAALPSIRRRLADRIGDGFVLTWGPSVYGDCWGLCSTSKHRVAQLLCCLAMELLRPGATLRVATIVHPIKRDGPRGACWRHEARLLAPSPLGCSLCARGVQGKGREPMDAGSSPK